VEEVEMDRKFSITELLFNYYTFIREVYEEDLEAEDRGKASEVCHIVYGETEMRLMQFLTWLTVRFPNEGC